MTYIVYKIHIYKKEVFQDLRFVVLKHLFLCCSVRNPNSPRSQSEQTPSAIQSDSVRDPIRFRSLYDDFY